jgi:hypothetical protein
MLKCSIPLITCIEIPNRKQGKTPADSDRDLPVPSCLRNPHPSPFKGPLTSVPEALEGIEGLEATQPQKKRALPGASSFIKNQILHLLHLKTHALDHF